MMQRTPVIPGVFAVDKPLGISSAHAVTRVRRWAQRVTGERRIKVGHGGTLDPLATGVLIIAVGRAYTREIVRYVHANKEYVGCVRLGWTSTTDDAEGAKVRGSAHVPSYAEIVSACVRFTGHVAQVPPVFSAIKKDGVPAYKRARTGDAVAMASRTVRIDAIDILSYTYPDVIVRVRCGKGTYIRALARDIGAVLGTGAYLRTLVRTRVGAFTLCDAYPLKVFR